MTSCFLKFHDLVTYALQILLLGLICGSFKFFPQASVVIPSFFVVYIFRSSILLIISCVVRGFLAFLSTCPSKITHYYLAHISYYCSTALSHSQFHIPLHRVFLPEYLALSLVEHITSPDPTFVYLFRNYSISFNLMQIFATSKLWSESISAPGFCKSLIKFPKGCAVGI